MEEILPILGFIAYVIFQVISATNKANKKKRNKPHSPSPSVNPAPSQKSAKQKDRGFIEEIERQIKELEQEVKPKPKPTLSPVSTPKEKPKRTTLSERRTLIKKTLKPVAKSAEITKPAYSNLEKGILDETHLSKLPHGQVQEAAVVEHRSYPNALKNFNAKEAFIHSIIFNRKYF